MAASASTNPAATVACFLLVLVALVVVAAGAREGPASAPAPQEADDDGSGSFDRPVATAAGPTQVPASAPVVPQGADSVGTVPFDRTVSRDSRRCDSDRRWNDQLCRTVCGMFKFHGYEFGEAAADEGQDAVPRCCCCCPGGATCNQL